jgi:hypothetical protein
LLVRVELTPDLEHFSATGKSERGPGALRFGLQFADAPAGGDEPAGEEVMPRFYFDREVNGVALPDSRRAYRRRAIAEPDAGTRKS